MISITDFSNADRYFLFDHSLISIHRAESGEIYWFSRSGLPWGTRENASFLSRGGFQDTPAQAISQQVAMEILNSWRSELNFS